MILELVGLTPAHAHHDRSRYDSTEQLSSPHYADAVDTRAACPDGLQYLPWITCICIEIPVSVPILSPTSYPMRYPVLM